MKRLGLLVTVAAMGAALFAGTAFAQDTSPDWADKNGGVGVGGNTTLGGTNGLSVRTYVSPLIGVMLNFGFDMESITVSPEEGDAGDTTTSSQLLDIGIYGSYKLAFWQRGSLAGLLGFDFRSWSMTVDAPGGDTELSASDITIGLGLRGEYFPTQYLSLHADFGITIDPLDDGDVDMGMASSGLGNSLVSPSTTDTENNDFSGMDIAVRADLWGSAGFTVWFQ